MVTSTAFRATPLESLGGVPRSATVTDCVTASPALSVYGQGNASGRT